MIYKVVVEGRFPSMNEFIEANRVGKGSWNKGNKMKREYQNIINHFLREQLPKLHLEKPIFIEYQYYEKNKKRDLDNISGFFHKIFQDALVESGIILNDNWYYIIGFSDEFFVDNKCPRIEIILREV